MKSKIIKYFNKFYYKLYDRRELSLNTRWQGIETHKLPFDLWVYQEIIFKNKPDIIIETGTYKGGTALYLAYLCDILKNGTVITIDVEKYYIPEHERIIYLIGSSISSEILYTISNRLTGKVMVILDSDHSYNHVYAELWKYSPFVTSGQYLIVEDTYLDDFNPKGTTPKYNGALRAVSDFLKIDNSFEIDKFCEKFYITFNPNGYLRKK